MATKLSTSASVLLFSAITVAVVSVAQAVLGFTQWFASAPAAVLSIHAILAQVAWVGSLVATAAAFWWTKGRASKGILWHAISVLVLALAQVALGEMAIVAAHIVVGLLFLLAAVALATLARKRVLTA